MRLIVVFLLAFSSLSLGQKEVGGSPFENGILNPKLEGQLIAVAGNVIEIKDGIHGRKLYKVDPHLEGVNPIWISPIAPVAKGQISKGIGLIFRGYIAIDPRISELIESPTFLLALQIDTPN